MQVSTPTMMSILASPFSISLEVASNISDTLTINKTTCWRISTRSKWWNHLLIWLRSRLFLWQQSSFDDTRQPKFSYFNGRLAMLWSIANNVNSKMLRNSEFDNWSYLCTIRNRNSVRTTFENTKMHNKRQKLPAVKVIQSLPSHARSFYHVIYPLESIKWQLLGCSWWRMKLPYSRRFINLNVFR